MKIVVFDTETTGLFDPDLPEDHMDQPWPVQLGVCVLQDFEITETLNTLIIPPEGVPFNESAVNLHGISPEVVLELGRPISDVFYSFSQLCRGAEIICTYNFAFDSRIMLTSARRIGFERPLWSPETYEHCIMVQAQEYFRDRLPLKRVYQRLFNRQLTDAHDAFADTVAATEVFRLLTAEINLEA